MQTLIFRLIVGYAVCRGAANGVIIAVKEARQV